MVVVCPHCSTRVILSNDHICPQSWQLLMDGVRDGDDAKVDQAAKIWQEADEAAGKISQDK